MKVMIEISDGKIRKAAYTLLAAVDKSEQEAAINEAIEKCEQTDVIELTHSMLGDEFKNFEFGIALTALSIILFKNK